MRLYGCGSKSKGTGVSSLSIQQGFHFGVALFLTHHILGHEGLILAQSRFLLLCFVVTGRI